jgi:biopolymer transport protein TolQ
MGCIIVFAAMGGRLASLDALSLIWQASWIVQLTILVLVLLSVGSWTIIAAKWRELRRAEQDSEAFVEVYRDGSLDAAFEAARDLDRSPLSTIFLAAYSEMNRIARFAGKKAHTPTLEPAHVDVLANHIQWTGSEEGLRLERGLNFLATTGSAAPFIGLFAAIPATVFYNYFLGDLRKLHAAIELFSTEYLEDLRRLSSASEASSRSVQT